MKNAEKLRNNGKESFGTGLRIGELGLKIQGGLIIEINMVDLIRFPLWVT